MEIAFILAVVAMLVFAALFIKALPAFDLMALGSAFFAASFAAYLWVTDGNMFR
jgi:hypothetical protein